MNKLVSLAVLLLPLSTSAALSARDIMKKNEENRKLQTVTSRATLITTGESQPERVKKFSWWKKLNADGKTYNTLTRFHEPAEIKGEGVLFLEHKLAEGDDEDDNEVFMYLPNFKKIRRVESQQQSGSFMGSEFSYSDISTPRLDDYNYKLLKDEPCGTLTCHVIESTPARESVRDRTGYSKSHLWTRTDNFMVTRADYYDLEGALLKKLVADEIKEVDPAGHKWMAHSLKIENLRKKRQTSLRFEEVRTGQDIPDSTFSQQNLARVQ